MTKLILAAFATGALIATASTAAAGGWGCRGCDYSNGTELTGIPNSGASASDVSAVILPSGEVVDLL